MTKFKLSIIALVLSIFGASAQNNTDAERITNDLVTKLNTQTLRANFKLDFFEKNNVISQSLSGNLILLGKKFHLNTPEVKAWFDGKTQWAYFAENNEVSITNPSAEELAETNPAMIISALKNKSTISFAKQKSNNVHIILLSPKQKERRDC
jgi:outer membrane lipoprotein-sorting protein